LSMFETGVSNLKTSNMNPKTIIAEYKSKDRAAKYAIQRGIMSVAIMKSFDDTIKEFSAAIAALETAHAADIMDGIDENTFGEKFVAQWDAADARCRDIERILALLR